MKTPASLRYLEVVLIGVPLAFCLQLFPFQHYMPLSRFQHFSFTIFGCAFAFLIQAIWSWRKMGICGRVALLGTVAYLLSAALVLYLNPWMDFDGSMNSELQIEFRRQLSMYFFLGGLPVASSWFAWAVEKENARRLLATGNKETTDTQNKVK